ncbi:hypothetical protein TKK_0008297 [Trichogramma kaykai]
MKFIAIALLCAILVSSILADLEGAKEWENFKSQFNKKYEGDEDQQRMKIFLDNKKLIEEHNAKYAKGEVSYTLGINQFADLTKEEIKKFHG